MLFSSPSFTNPKNSSKFPSKKIPQLSPNFLRSLILSMPTIYSIHFVETFLHHPLLIPTEPQHFLPRNLFNFLLIPSRFIAIDAQTFLSLTFFRSFLDKYCGIMSRDQRNPPSLRHHPYGGLCKFRRCTPTCGGNYDVPFSKPCSAQAVCCADPQAQEISLLISSSSTFYLDRMLSQPVKKGVHDDRNFLLVLWGTG
jgi:hypothetical protein